jgi:arabinogalactan endo-1,4-beta-galactosidase
MIQVGNEVTNGLLWPNGKKPEYDNIARFISAGIRAVRAVDANLPIMIHLDKGTDNELYRDWFDHYMERGEDFDVIGLSYYPFWHGSLSDLAANMKDISERYQKDVIVAEVSMGFTMEDYQSYEKLSAEERKGMATKAELAEKVPFPMTPEGQRDFMKAVMQVIRDVPNGRGKGFYYWEPAWLPVPGSGWATPESLAYIGDKGPCGNEWANQALFDYDGNALPALAAIRDF